MTRRTRSGKMIGTETTIENDQVVNRDEVLVEEQALSGDPPPRNQQVADVIDNQGRIVQLPHRGMNRGIEEQQFNLDLRGYTQQQVDVILQVASAFPHQGPTIQPRGSQLNQHGENEHSEAHNHPRRTKSIMSRLGPSQNTEHKNHGGPQHGEHTWKENRRKRDLRKDIEEKRAEYEKAKEKFEKNARRVERTPEPRNDTGSIHPTNADMLNTILELKRKLEGGSGVETGESPFTKRLESEAKQRHIKHNNLSSFDGLGDPEEHLSYFDQLALHYEYKDLTRCRFFAATLRGGAQRWFCRIPSRSLDSWLDFKKAFLKKFKANQPHEVHTVFLETVAQRNGETLQDYIDRFKEAVNKVVSVNETEALGTFKKGAQPLRM